MKALSGLFLLLGSVLSFYSCWLCMKGRSRLLEIVWVSSVAFLGIGSFFIGDMAAWPLCLWFVLSGVCLQAKLDLLKRQKIDSELRTLLSARKNLVCIWRATRAYDRLLRGEISREAYEKLAVQYLPPRNIEDKDIRSAQEEITALVRAFGKDANDFSVREIAEMLNLHNTTVHRAIMDRKKKCDAGQRTNPLFARRRSDGRT